MSVNRLDDAFFTGSGRQGTECERDPVRARVTFVMSTTEQQAIPSEVLGALYGGIVRQLVADLENVQLVSEQLKKMGRSMGQRMIDEYLATTGTTRCVDFKTTAEKVATVGLKLFLNATASVSVRLFAVDRRARARQAPVRLSVCLSLARACSLSPLPRPCPPFCPQDWNAEGTACTIAITGNPLCDFVTLPSELKALEYNNIIAGAIEGALEMINCTVEVSCEKDVLRGDTRTELKMLLIDNRNEEFPWKDD